MKKAIRTILSLTLALLLSASPAVLTVPIEGASVGRLLGDINNDADVSIDDALALFRHSMLPDIYTVSYPGTLDFTADGNVDLDDVLRLFQYSMLPDTYPIQWWNEDFVMFDPAEVFDAKKISLSFNSANLCSSARDAKGEGVNVSYAAWNGTYNVALNNCYGLYYNLVAHKLLMSVAFYDRNGNYISGVGTDAMTNYAASVTGFVVRPKNAVYARFLGFSGTEVIPAFDHYEVLSFATEEAYLAAKSMYKFDGLKIACIGDSLTEGDYGPITSYGGRRFENYPYYLSHLTGAETVNYGRCGASSSSYYYEHYNRGDVDVSDADIILLMLGTNKGLAEDTPFHTDYVRLVNEILTAKKPSAQLILITPPSATTDPAKINYGYMDNVLSANAAVKAIAKEKGLICFDALNDSPIQPETEERYQSFDGLHMNAAGYEAFARYIAEELDKILH